MIRLLETKKMLVFLWSLIGIISFASICFANPTISDPWIFTSNLGAKPNGTSPMYLLDMGVTVSDPLGVPNNISSVTASGLSGQPSFTLTYQPSGVLGVMYEASPHYYGWTGSWRVTATNLQGQTHSIDTPFLSDPRQIPLTSNIHFSDSSTTPAVTWNRVYYDHDLNPSTPDVEVGGYQLRLMTPVSNYIYSSGWFKDPVHTIPGGVLHTGQEFWVRINAKGLETQAGGSYNNRSSTFTTFTPTSSGACHITFPTNSDVITNPYMSNMKVGTTWEFNGYGGEAGRWWKYTVTGRATYKTVSCVVVRLEKSNGDYEVRYLAQDTEGNIRRLRELGHEADGDYEHDLSSCPEMMVPNNPYVGQTWTVGEVGDTSTAIVSSVNAYVDTMSAGQGPFATCLEIEWQEGAGLADYDYDYYSPTAGGPVKFLEEGGAGGYELTGITSDNCSTFDFSTSTLHVPCLDLGTHYWLDLKLIGDPIVLRLNGYGESTGGEPCATFDLFTNTLHMPCLKLDQSYWLDLYLTGTDPITFGLKDFGLN